jgi:pimeloyl-ACP methyl ester carboxylesterase
MQPRALDIPYLLDGAFYRMACTAWGDPHAQPVICVHGLTRQSRDFDALAIDLARDFYVLCPDLPGRGRSAWLPAAALYQPPSYVQALSHLLAFVERPVYWVGTSLGGICGMLIAAAHGQPIQRMVLNDIGPFVPRSALERIAAYISDVPEFADAAALQTYLRRVHAPFGTLTDAQWSALAEHSTRHLPDGRPALHYDPALTEPMRAGPLQDIDLWPFWERIAIPLLALRGETSDLLLPDTLARMSARAQTHVVPGAGHAPALMDAPTIAVIRAFLEQDGLCWTREA